MDYSKMGYGAHGAAMSDNPFVQAYTAVNDRMHADLTVEFTVDPEVDCMRGVIPHQSAIDMACVALEHGTDPQVRTLTEEMIATQEGTAQDVAWIMEINLGAGLDVG